MSWRASAAAGASWRSALRARIVGHVARGNNRPNRSVNARVPATSRGAAFGDLDNDGGLDIVVVNRDAPAYVLHNVVANRGHWIRFRVIDEHGRDALGATVSASVGSRRVKRDVQPAFSYLSSNDPRVHIGLGAVARATDVTVTWVDGQSESFGAFAADGIRVLRRGAGVQVTPEPSAR